MYPFIYQLHILLFRLGFNILIESIILRSLSWKWKPKVMKLLMLNMKSKRRGKRRVKVQASQRQLWRGCLLYTPWNRPEARVFYFCTKRNIRRIVIVIDKYIFFIKFGTAWSLKNETQYRILYTSFIQNSWSICVVWCINKKKYLTLKIKM